VHKLLPHLQALCIAYRPVFALSRQSLKHVAPFSAPLGATYCAFACSVSCRTQSIITAPGTQTSLNTLLERNGRVAIRRNDGLSSFHKRFGFWTEQNGVDPSQRIRKNGGTALRGVPIYVNEMRNSDV